jgi:hypothetical protein
MAHQRKTIRDQVITSLTGLTTTGTRVFNSRIYPNEQSKLPLLNVYTISESSELDAVGSLLRSMDLVVEGFASANSNIENTLDTIAKEVEEALGSDITLNNTCKNHFISSTEVTLANEGSLPIGVVRLVFTVIYRTTQSDVEALI